MKPYLVLFMIPWMIRAIFGTPSDYIQAVDEDLKDMQCALSQGNYQLAHEKMNEVVGEFNYVRTVFPKKEGQKWLKDMDQFGRSISILNIKASQKQLVKLQDEWDALKAKKITLKEHYQ